MIKLFYVTDIHGSNVCYRKFLNALPIYGVDVAVLNGDLLGKVLIPMVEKPGGGWECHLMGMYTEMNTERSSPTSRRSSRTRATTGCTRPARSSRPPRPTPRRSTSSSSTGPTSASRSGSSWPTSVSRARTTTMYICPGNDDWWEVDDMISCMKVIKPCDNMVVDIDGHEMVSCSRSNPTPWDTPREESEEELAVHLDELCKRVSNYESAIFNFHVPPYGYSLDLCPKLDENMKMAAEEKIHAGSQGAKQVIEKYQPLLGLHGHIHESRGAQKAGRTLMINPGSEYSEGILKGVIIMLDKKKVKDYVFTQG